MTKYLILTNNLLNSYKKSSQITTEKDFDIVPKFIAIQRWAFHYSIDYKKYDKTKYGIFLFKEKESWLLGNIDKEIDSNGGKKIVSINNIPINEIEQKIIAFESGENEYWKYFAISFQLHFSFLLGSN
jgi:hypothetical protein